MAYIFDVKVVPSSGQNKWKFDKAGHLKCYLKSPPENGKANSELIKIIAKLLKITQAEVTIIAGAISRTKKIRIESDITFKQLLDSIGLEQPIDAIQQQTSLFDK